jgi:hypothetical protein
MAAAIKISQITGPPLAMSVGMRFYRRLREKFKAQKLFFLT